MNPVRPEGSSGNGFFPVPRGNLAVSNGHPNRSDTYNRFRSRFQFAICDFTFRNRPMSYLVVARKWGPQSFEDIAGQAHITRTLHNAIRDRPHRPCLSIYRDARVWARRPPPAKPKPSTAKRGRRRSPVTSAVFAPRSLKRQRITSWKSTAALESRHR